MCLSSLSNTRVEEVCAAAAGSPVWFQLYVYRDRAATAALVARAEAAGASAIVLTVDAPLLGRRERDVRNQFHLPEGLRVENMSAVVGHGEVELRTASSGLAAYFAEKLDPALTWKDVAWLRSITRLPVLVKGTRPPRRRAPSRRSWRQRHRRQQPRRPPARRLARDGHRPRAPSPTRCRDASRSSSTAASGAAPTSFARWRWARERCSWVAPSSGASPPPAKQGARAVLETLRAEIDHAMALTGCATRVRRRRATCSAESPERPERRGRGQRRAPGERPHVPSLSRVGRARTVTSRR